MAHKKKAHMKEKNAHHFEHHDSKESPKSHHHQEKPHMEKHKKPSARGK